MSRLHRSASAQMSRPAISIRSERRLDVRLAVGADDVLPRAGRSWTSELREMDECMPHYYKITDGHGQGAERIMRCRGGLHAGAFHGRAHRAGERLCPDRRTTGRKIWRSAATFWRGGSHCMPACSSAAASSERVCGAAAAAQRRVAATSGAPPAAYYYALQRRDGTDSGDVSRSTGCASVQILAPGRPMMEMIENQVYLAQGAYAKVIGRSAELLAVCAGMHYALVALHVRVQTAAAYERLGKHARTPARALVRCAAATPSQDGSGAAVCGKLPLSCASCFRGSVRRRADRGRDHRSSARRRSAARSRGDRSRRFFAALTARERRGRAPDRRSA